MSLPLSNNPPASDPAATQNELATVLPIGPSLACRAAAHRRRDQLASVTSPIDYDWQASCVRYAGDFAGTPLEIWAHCCPELHWCRTLTQMLDCCQLDNQAACYLVGRAQQGDQLAGRVVLQALLPRLKAQARRNLAYPLDDFLAAAWERIMSHPVATRRNKVLTNLALDALKQLSRAAHRERREQPAGDLGEVIELRPQHHPGASPNTATSLIATAVEQGWVSAAAGQVLHSVYVTGLSGREAARKHQISESLVRYRCSAAVHKMRTHRAELGTIA